MIRFRHVGLACSVMLGLLGLGLNIGPQPAAASTGVAGNVQCLTMPVEGVWIAAASGGSGWASWSTHGNPTAASYHYSLPHGGKYAVHVGCGGSPARWLLSAYSGFYGGTYNNFLCYDEPYESYYKYCQHT